MRKKITSINYFLLLSVFLMLALSSCEKDPDTNQVAYDAADRVNGGRLYDKFWADETNFVSPSDASVVMADIEDYGDFYRCKQCHGWDQLGTLGAYIDRGPKTTRPDVASNDLTHVKTEEILEVFNAIKHSGGAAVDAARTADGTNVGLGGNNMPDYGKILSDAQIWDLVKFLREGAFDTEELYTLNITGAYPTGSRTFSNVGEGGDVAAGVIFYDTNCSGCHGANGRDDGNGNIIDINEDIGRSIGEFVREKPYELQHKTVYGNLGSTMSGTNDASQDDVKNMFAALSDVSNYPDL